MLSRLSLVLCAFLLVTTTAFARPNPSVARQARSFPAPPIRARAAVVLDAATGQVLAAKNPHLHLPMASTTKIMTALIALQLGKLSDRITVPKAAFDFESDATVMGLHPGQVVTLHDLLYGLLLPSGADAANTIAIHYGGSEAGFVTLMNRGAAMLGLQDTHYANAHGLTAPNNYTSAHDLALLGEYVSSVPELLKITSTRTYTWDGHTLTNLNRLLFWYPGVDGIKPGYTGDAGICQVLDVRRDGRHVVVALLNTPDLVIDARNLLNFGLRDFSWIQSTLTGDHPALMVDGADSQGPYVYFPGSGHYIRGQFWKAYLANGGLDALGFPRTEPLWEGGQQIQYFQNGALSSSSATALATRQALGLTPLPAPGTIPSPPPTSIVTLTPTTTPKPVEHTIAIAIAPPTATASGSPTAIGTPLHATPTPRARSVAASPPPPSPLPTPGPASSAVTARVFAAFQRTHRSMLGSPVSTLYALNGYDVQVFDYGALAYAQRSRVTYILPLGDRLLSARQYLPAHPGNVYPAGFAPVSVLNAIGWLPGQMAATPWSRQ